MNDMIDSAEADVSDLVCRGCFVFESRRPARDLEADILMPRIVGGPPLIFSVPITRDDGKPSSITIRFLDEPGVIWDAGTTYRGHLVPQRENEVREVIVLIPNPAGDGTATVIAAY